ncbi:fermitin family homolog 2-like isoform X2 [Apostichopus japonicus]|uniref:fermitin family homolog 2-like isoform X2 n=1 Tax=Stichopus japonicus TaxID=307972 RepID=UPI003AB11E0E
MERDPHMFKLPDGKYADGSWELNIHVTDLDIKKTLRVTGDQHIGGVMLKLVEELDQTDWSDHAFWWPEKNEWLMRTRSTLDQCHVQADATLEFTPMHKYLRVQMPDMQIIEMKVDFSGLVFNAVQELAKDIGIRHPEEMSFLRKPIVTSLKHRKQSGANGRKVSGANGRKKSRDRDSMASSNSNDAASMGSMDGIAAPQTPTRRLSPAVQRTGYNGSPSMNSAGSLDSFELLNTSLVNSPAQPSKEAMDGVLRPSSYREKATINGGWLDSSKSLMQQGINERDVLLLRFKYYAFYDLDPQQDAIRINQIYEQARWSLLNDEIDCTEEEMIMFAALQLQASLRGDSPTENDGPEGQDDIDKALNSLQVTLEGTTMNPGQSDITSVPELNDSLKFFRPKKFTLKSMKRGYFIFRDTHLTQYKSSDDTSGTPVQKLNLKGCEVSPDVNISGGKFGIKLLAEGQTELWLRCDTAEQYSKWMAACRLASKGKTMADSTYNTELQSIQAFLAMQQGSHNSVTPTMPSDVPDFQPESFVSQRYLKKYKRSQIATKILEAHGSVRIQTTSQSKMSFIRAWQALPEYGITYFVVKFRNSKKEELFGVAHNRLIKFDINSGDSQKTWRYSTMTAWHVNWEVKEVMVEMEEEKIQFSCHSADCKIVHEFIGGYIFLSMRSPDQNQTLNEELFMKLTGGWV